MDGRRGGLNRRQLLCGALAQGLLLASGCASTATSVAGGAAPGGVVAGRRRRRRGKGPSVLFIAIDDLNDWTGFLGGRPGFETPSLDRLAAEGTAFTRAYASAAACNPSRASLLTGRAPWHLGLYDNAVSLATVAPRLVTLPEVFRAHGYQALGGGKIFHGSFPKPEAWDEYLPPPREPAPRGRPLHGLVAPEAFAALSGLSRLFDWGPTELPVERTGDGQLVQWAREVLARSVEGPLFLGVGFAKPHLPWYVPRSYYDLFPAESIELPAVLAGDLDDTGPLAQAWVASQTLWPQLLSDPELARRGVQAYLAAARFVDDRVGELLAAWEASPYADGGVVVLWSDHGFHLGEKLHWRKATPWEEATRVPLIVRAPAVAQPGVACGRPTSLLDVFPTLLELCGLPPVAGLDGASLAPWLREPAAPAQTAAVTAWFQGSAAVRDERYRYIRYLDGFEELYDHDADPDEWTNRAAEPGLAAVKQRLAAFLPARWAAGGQPDPGGARHD